MKKLNVPFIRIALTVLFILSVSLCIAFVLYSAPSAAYAENSPVEEQDTDDPAEPSAPEENKWITPPDIVRWTYGNFHKATNVITATPEHGTVVFSVLRHDLSIINDTLSEFEVNGKGEVPDEVEAELKKLPVASKGYMLSATVKEADEYSRLNGATPFDVIKATNNWLVPPAVLGWRYGEYDPEINFINAVPAYGAENMRFILYAQNKTGSYEMKLFNENGQTSPFFGYTADGTFSDYMQREFTYLDSGTYSLVAMVPNTENYTGLNTTFASADTGVIFNISPTVNNWLSAPSIVQWSWNSFDRAINVLTAVPAFPAEPAEKRVKFGIYTDSLCGTGSVVSGLDEFYTKSGTANGEQVESRVVEILRTLDAGTYYLLAETEIPRDKENPYRNYADLKTVVPFTVHKNMNYWTSTPNVVQWNWSEYDPEINLITATPAYPARNADVRFNVFEEDGYTFAFDQPQEGFTLDSDIESQLSSLGAGTYCLRATSAGSVNFRGLDTKVTFKIRRMQNHWLTTPSVFEWNYGEYDKSLNRINAASAFGSVDVSVYFGDGEAVLFDDNGNLTTSFTFAEGGSIPEYVSASLKYLKTGTYYMLASVAADNADYTGLNNYSDFEEIKSHAIKFEVSPASNGWVTVPKILSWSEGHYDSETNGIYAEAKAGNDKMYIFVIDENNRILTSNSGGNKLDYDMISKLGVGSYRIRFVVEATDDYAGLDSEITFAVFEDSVGLNGIIAAVIVFAVIDTAAAGACIAIIIIRRRKIEQGFRKMIRKELNRR